jgi:hypothetical protein
MWLPAESASLRLIAVPGSAALAITRGRTTAIRLEHLLTFPYRENLVVPPPARSYS